MGLFRRDHRPDEEVVDLSAAEAIDLREPTRIEFGMPMPCPECNDPGYLDHIDPYKRVMSQHCPSCFHKWETAESEIAALHDA